MNRNSSIFFLSLNTLVALLTTQYSVSFVVALGTNEKSSYVSNVKEIQERDNLQSADNGITNWSRPGTRKFTSIPRNVAVKANTRSFLSWNKADGSANITWSPRCHFLLFHPDIRFSLPFDTCYWKAEEIFCSHEINENVRQTNANFIYYNCFFWVQPNTIHWTTIKMISSAAKWLYSGCDENTKLSQCNCGHHVAVSQIEEREKAKHNIALCDAHIRNLVENNIAITAHLGACKTEMEKITATSYRNIDVKDSQQQQQMQQQQQQQMHQQQLQQQQQPPHPPFKLDPNEMIYD